MNEGPPPGPDSKGARSTLFDSGWSAAPPPAAPLSLPPIPQPPPPLRRPPFVNEPPKAAAPALPSYESKEGTGRDQEGQSLIKARREKATLPPPRRASAFPSVPPPLPLARPHESVPPVAVPPQASVPPPPLARPHESVDGDRSSAKVVEPPRAPLPSSEPNIATARTDATLPRPRAGEGPPALPSFAAALAQRVRFAGGEVPLWSLVTPLVLLVGLGTAFTAAAVTSGADPITPVLGLKPSADAPESARSLPPPTLAAPTSATSAEDKPKALTMLERVAQGQDAAVVELSRKPVSELSIEEAISLSRGQSAQGVRAARALRDRLDHDPGLIKDPDLLAQLRHYTDEPETARDALSAMADLPGPIGADLVYEVWAASTSRTTATELARALSYGKELRAKASPALTVALDLRDADSCEKSHDLIERATSDGDRRAYHLLAKLTRKYGCGPNKRADCYACLRSSTDLDAAMKAVKARREPRLSGG